MSNNPIDSWASKIGTGLDVLMEPNRFLTRPPTGDPPALATLLDVRSRLCTAGGADSKEPAWSDALANSSRFTGENRHHSLTEWLRETLTGLEASICAALAAGATDPRVIATSDFGELRTMGVQVAHADNAVILFLGLTRSLAPGHPLRDTLPADAYYRSNGDLAVALGPGVNYSDRPRPWYWATDCVRLTHHIRGRQRLKEQELADQMKAEEEARIRAFWDSPAGRAESARRQLETMRAKGLVPEKEL